MRHMTYITVTVNQLLLICNDVILSVRMLVNVVVFIIIVNVVLFISIVMG